MQKINNNLILKNIIDINIKNVIDINININD